MSFLAQQEEFGTLGDEWRNLNSGLATATIFNTPEWLRVWWDSFHTSEELLLYSFRKELGGKKTGLVGVAPLMRSGDTIRFIGLSDLCDSHDLSLSLENDREICAALLEALTPLSWRTIEMDGLFEDSAALQLMPQAAKDAGFQVSTTLDEVSPALKLPGTWEEYLQSLRKKDRHELRRKLRKLFAAGEVKHYDAANPETIADDVAGFLDLLRKSREDKAAFLTPSREAFFHNLAESMVNAGHLKLFFLELDGIRVASSMCFDYQGAYYLYNSGYDPSFGSLSVGLIMKALAVQDAIERGRTMFHFLRGAEPYKYDLGAEDYRLCKLVITR